MSKINTGTRIYIANLGKYNEGKLVGGWIDLPFSEDELNELFVEIGLGEYDEDGEYVHGKEVNGVVYEEYAIHDYETDIENYKIGEYEDLEELNELFQRVQDLDNYERDKLYACIEATGYKLEQCLELVEDESVDLYGDCDTLADLAEQFFNDGYYGECSKELSNHIDFESLGRDLRFDNYYESEYGVVRVD